MALAKEDIERLDERYIKKDDCTVIRTDQDKRMDAIMTEITIAKTKLNILIGILIFIATPVFAIALKFLFGVGG